jgi:hypothetical protein
MSQLYHLIPRARDGEREGPRRTFWLGIGEPVVIDSDAVVTFTCDFDDLTGYRFNVAVRLPSVPGWNQLLGAHTREPIELPTVAHCTLYVIAVEYQPSTLRPIRVLLDLVRTAPEAVAAGI